MRQGRDGFTLIEVVIAIAMIAIMAATIGPAAIRQYNKTRETATVDELERIREGLLAYHEDIGAFPAESEGLAALIGDTGHANWNGPYLEFSGDNPVRAISTDGFGNAYLYDLAPSTTPAGAADLIVASLGINHAADLGGVGQTWNLAEVSDHDDLVLLVSDAANNRVKRLETERELRALETAAKRYWYANGIFPASLDDLTAAFLDPGVADDAFLDGWSQSYLLSSSGGGAPVLTLWSAGENQRNDTAGGDDIALTIDSDGLEQQEPEEYDWSVEGSYSLYLVEQAQAALDAAPGLSLSGDELAAYLGDLGLSAIYEHDDWGNRLLVNVSARRIYSAGPDGSRVTTADNIPAGAGP